MKRLILILIIMILTLTCFSQEEEWKKARKINTIEAYQEFKKNYPNSKYMTIVDLYIDQFKTNESTLKEGIDPVKAPKPIRKKDLDKLHWHKFAIRWRIVDMGLITVNDYAIEKYGFAKHQSIGSGFNGGVQFLGIFVDGGYKWNSFNDKHGDSKKLYEYIDGLPTGRTFSGRPIYNTNQWQYEVGIRLPLFWNINVQASVGQTSLRGKRGTAECTGCNVEKMKFDGGKFYQSRLHIDFLNDSYIAGSFFISYKNFFSDPSTFKNFISIGVQYIVDPY